ncbi:hypothetical protein [Agrococcus sp. KRD186]|uniref:hypothetical protein n=1 Tax=Agrococcus sp. KRD186 TaxID=2729730 RepID=UPI0019D104AE|nr:hypothetical protein [Agrococcus sp. KRD186]
MRKVMDEGELRWFEEQSPAWAWKWASTFEGGAEHAYVIKGRQLDAQTYERAARVIHGMGMPRRFFRRLNIELHLPDVEVAYGREPLGQRSMQHGVKLWLMSHRTSVSKALNIAPLTAEYGRQDAPSTAPAVPSPWDLRALDFDDAFESAGLAAFADRLRDAAPVGGPANHVLDLGARTGAALDLGLASRAGGCTAVEASRGLLHSLLFKHQWVRDVHVMSAEAYLAARNLAPSATVVSLFGAASYLRPETISALAEAGHRLVLMHHADDPERDFFSATHLPPWSAASRSRAAQLPGRVERLGDYVLTVVEALRRHHHRR